MIDQLFQQALQRQTAGDLAHAEALYRQVLAVQPAHIGTLANLGRLFETKGDLPSAAACYRTAIEHAPNGEALHYNLAQILRVSGEWEQAIVHYRRATALAPHFAPALLGLAGAYLGAGREREAIETYQTLLRLPVSDQILHAAAFCNLGVILRGQNRLPEAEIAYRNALRIAPELPLIWNNLAEILCQCGRLPESLESYRKAVALAPADSAFHSHLIFTMQFDPATTPESMRHELRLWSQRHAEPHAPPATPRTHDPSPTRKLRIGYVSPDFRDHCQALFTLPLLSNHDRTKFEIICYSGVAQPDAVTQRIQRHAGIWRHIAGMPDHQLAELIRKDQVDILVDLTMHMAGGRLGAFARRPASVQVCWLAYPGSTGVSAIDYRLTDPHLDPADANDAAYSEASYRLPETFWCYAPLEETLDEGPPPCLGTGHVTFGCLNNFCKVNPQTLALWAQVIKAVPNSHLLLLAEEGSHRADVIAFLAQAGIAPAQIGFAGKRPRPDYLALYRQIDISLDTLPYNGHTTTLDSLFMGVPVVTLPGTTVVGRAGLSQLTNLGMPELIAQSPDDFVRIATDLAHDLPRLQTLRATLRTRMQASPLMDAARFASAIESVYRDMWQKWCAQP